LAPSHPLFFPTYPSPNFISWRFYAQNGLRSRMPQSTLCSLTCIYAHINQVRYLRPAHADSIQSHLKTAHQIVKTTDPFPDLADVLALHLEISVCLQLRRRRTVTKCEFHSFTLSPPISKRRPSRTTYLKRSALSTKTYSKKRSMLSGTLPPERMFAIGRFRPMQVRTRSWSPQPRKNFLRHHLPSWRRL
jgi:hypothetical protein